MFKLLWLLLFPISLCSQLNEQTVLSSHEIRNATFEDLDDITDAIIAAYSTSNFYNYVYQFREKYPEDHRQCFRSSLAQPLNDPNTVFQVIKMSTGDPNTVSQPIKMSTGGIGSVEKAVASGIWIFPGSELETSMFTLSSLDECTYRDANQTRKAALGKIMRAGKEKYLDVITTDYIYLGGLETHPDFQGRGAAGAILRSGIAMARERGLDLTLIATEEGEPVYKHMGFESIANITIPTLEGDQTFRFDVMFYNISSPVIADS